MVFGDEKKKCKKKMCEENIILITYSGHFLLVGVV